MSLFPQVKPLIDHALARLDVLLDKAEAHAGALGCGDAPLLAARLFPDMIDTRRNILNVCDITHRGAFRLAGKEPPSFANDEATFADLKARVATARQGVAELDDDALGAVETIRFNDHMGREKTVTPETFVLRFLLPNVHFHMAVTYALLRSQGVELGKDDIMGELPTV